MYKRINKRVARKLYEDGIPFLIIPCKCNPLAAWLMGATITKHERSFDQLINEFTYYNCNHEVGYYPAFYEEVTK